MAIVIDGNNTPTAGGIGYGDGTELAFTTVGTSGQLLQSNGASAPSWVAAPTSAVTFVASVTASNSATADLDNAMTAYNVYMVVADQIITTGGSNPSLDFQLKVGGTYQTGSSYQYHNSRLTSASSSYGAAVGTSATSVPLTGALRANGPVSFVLYLYKPSDATTYKLVSWQGGYFDSSPNPAYGGGAASWIGSTSAITGIRFFTSGANITSGTFRLYGIANS
jgi:hypothetical protein